MRFAYPPYTGDEYLGPMAALNLESAVEHGFVGNPGVPGKATFAHFIGMGLLSCFMVLGFSSRATHGRPLNPLARMAAATLLVTLDEVIQLAIPSRTFSLDDLAGASPAFWFLD